jgi:methionyl-tRNA formyltransferase
MKELVLVGQIPTCVIEFMSQLRCLVLCSSRLALPTLQELIFFGQLAAVGVPVHCTEFIEEVQYKLSGTGVPLFSLEKVNLDEALCKIIKEYDIDLGLVLTFSFKISPVVFNCTKKGFYNVHPGPLPEYRGPDPVFQQIRNKEPYAAVTIHQITEELDCGPVVMIQKVHLQPTDTYGVITLKLSLLAAMQIRTLLKLASLAIPIPVVKQDESKAHYYKKQVGYDIMINWEQMDADDIIALMNACNPWNKGAVTRINNKIIRLLHGVRLSNMQDQSLPGTVIGLDTLGVKIATLHNQIIQISFFYTDEGFVNASMLSDIGVVIKPGDRFDSAWS